MKNSELTENTAELLRKMRCEIATKYKKRREEDISDNNALNKLKKQNGIEVPILKHEELKLFIYEVLSTGKTGTKIIEEYTKKEGKSELWRKTISRKNFNKKHKNILKSFEEHDVIIQLKKNNLYCCNDICRNSVTGALNMLSKQIKLCNKIIKQLKKQNQLKELLEIKHTHDKGQKFDRDLAQRLRDDGHSTRQIANALNVSSSSISKYTTARISV